MALEVIGEVVAKTAEMATEAAKAVTEVTAQAVEQSGEFVESQVNECALNRTIVIKPDMILIKDISLKSLMASNAERFYQGVNESGFAEKVVSTAFEGQAIDVRDITPEIDTTSLEKVGLTDEQKAFIIKETGWPPEIVEYIDSMKQYEVYKEANLHYAEIDGRPCLIKDIDMGYVDAKTGLTNRELMEKGRSPIDAKTGEKIELHHMGQDFNSPFAELCENNEHGDGKHGILHDNNVESWRKDPEKKNEYNITQRPNHWKARAAEVKA